MGLVECRMSAESDTASPSVVSIGGTASLAEGLGAWPGTHTEPPPPGGEPLPEGPVVGWGENWQEASQCKEAPGAASSPIAHDPLLCRPGTPVPQAGGSYPATGDDARKPAELSNLAMGLAAATSSSRQTRLAGPAFNVASTMVQPPSRATRSLAGLDGRRSPLLIAQSVMPGRESKSCDTEHMGQGGVTFVPKIIVAEGEWEVHIARTVEKRMPTSPSTAPSTPPQGHRGMMARGAAPRARIRSPAAAFESSADGSADFGVPVASSSAVSSQASSSGRSLQPHMMRLGPRQLGRGGGDDDDGDSPDEGSDGSDGNGFEGGPGAQLLRGAKVKTAVTSKGVGIGGRLAGGAAEAAAVAGRGDGPLLGSRKVAGRVNATPAGGPGRIPGMLLLAGTSGGAHVSLSEPALDRAIDIAGALRSEPSLPEAGGGAGLGEGSGGSLLSQRKLDSALEVLLDSSSTPQVRRHCGAGGGHDLLAGTRGHTDERESRDGELRLSRRVLQAYAGLQAAEADTGAAQPSQASPTPAAATPAFASWRDDMVLSSRGPPMSSRGPPRCAAGPLRSGPPRWQPQRLGPLRGIFQEQEATSDSEPDDGTGSP
eukprot:CAMPEP_0115183968 /NCGR_PEP_ID=MMETSP0270-20121206/8721_1 /TAXON_ID=71861 /ORGANISM="Scrippsiella trochoidea, Strain CCMP3099" /LENGTH=597 /DNA_ID=CAMNT_0002597041 /DNA_START=23 /DNA_END=1813 /DNA_ORIENTATION=-